MAKLKDVGYGASQESFLQLVKRYIGIYWYMANTFWFWFYYGGKIRKAYKKCVDEDRIYYIDKMFPEEQQNK